MRFTASIIIFLIVISSSDLKEEERHHRPPYKPTPSNGLLLPNAFKVLLLVYLASLAATLHFLNTNVNITNLMGRELHLNARHQPIEEQEQILTKLTFN